MLVICVRLKIDKKVTCFEDVFLNVKNKISIKDDPLF